MIGLNYDFVAGVGAVIDLRFLAINVIACGAGFAYAYIVFFGSGDQNVALHNDLTVLIKGDEVGGTGKASDEDQTLGCAG